MKCSPYEKQWNKSLSNIGGAFRFAGEFNCYCNNKYNRNQPGKTGEALRQYLRRVPERNQSATTGLCGAVGTAQWPAEKTGIDGGGVKTMERTCTAPLFYYLES